MFDYAPEDEMVVRNRISCLKNKNLKGTDGFELVVYDLYDLIIDHLQSKNFMEKCYAQEKKRGIRKLQDAIQHTLKITDKENLLVKYIAEETSWNFTQHPLIHCASFSMKKMPEDKQYQEQGGRSGAA